MSELFDRVRRAKEQRLNAMPGNEPAQNSPNQGEGGFGASFRAGLGQAVSSMVPFGNSARRIKSDIDQGQQPTSWDRTTGGVVKAMSGNTLGFMGATAETVDNAITGTPNQPFSELLGQYQYASDQTTNLTGEIIGSVTPGSLTGGTANVAAKLANTGRVGKLMSRRDKLGMLGRASTAAAIGGSTTFLYSAAGGASMEEAGEDAMYGAMFNMGADQLFRGIQAVKDMPAFRDYLRDKPLSKVAVDIYEGIEAEMGPEFEQYLKADREFDIPKLINDLSVTEKDVALESLYAPMIADVKQYFRAAQEPGRGGRAMYNAVRRINEYAKNLNTGSSENFINSVDEVFNSPQVRGSDEVAVQGAQLRSQLAPQRAAALNAVPPKFRYKGGTGTPMPVSVQTVDKIIATSGRTATKLTDEKAIRQRMMDMISRSYRDVPKRVQDRTGAPAKKDVTTFTNQQLDEYISRIDNFIYSGKMPADLKKGLGAEPYDKMMLKKVLAPIRNNLKELLYQRSSGLRQIDGQYSTEVRMRKAHEAGRLAAKGRGRADGDVTDAYDAFNAMFDRAPAEQAAFAEGVKAEMIGALQGKTPRQVKDYFDNPANKDRMHDIQEMITLEGMNSLRQSAARFILQSDIAGLAMEGPGPARSMGKAASPLTSGIDAATVLGAGAGMLSSSLAAGAVRRQAANRPKGPMPSLTDQAEVISDIASMPTEQALGLIQQGLFDTLPQASGGTKITPALMSDD